MIIAFVAQEEDPQRWLPRLREALPRDRFVVWPDVGDPGEVAIALVAKPPRGALAALPRLKLVQSLWMGVDGLIADPTLPRSTPIARLIDPGMVGAMSETVLACVLDWHRCRYRYRAQQARREWRPLPQHMAADRSIGLLGLGELGQDAAAKLRALGFNVCGWSRRPKRIEGVACHHGDTGLADVLARSGVIVCLLPLTAATRGILNAATLARLPEGASVVNLARGGHVVEHDLLAALDSGRLAHAYLDVFETEPLAADHPFWTHPAITVTPHVAALTEPRTSLAKVVANIERVRRGERPEALVDVAAGY